MESASAKPPHSNHQTVRGLRKSPVEHVIAGLQQLCVILLLLITFLTWQAMFSWQT